jgi:hypothetical protein
MVTKEKPREISENSHDINLERIKTFAGEKILFVTVLSQDMILNTSRKLCLCANHNFSKIVLELKIS